MSSLQLRSKTRRGRQHVVLRQCAWCGRIHKALTAADSVCFCLLNHLKKGAA